jgi:hypothetical protein
MFFKGCCNLTRLDLWFEMECMDVCSQRFDRWIGLQQSSTAGVWLPCIASDGNELSGEGCCAVGTGLIVGTPKGYCYTDLAIRYRMAQGWSTDAASLHVGKPGTSLPSDG